MSLKLEELNPENFPIYHLFKEKILDSVENESLKEYYLKIFKVAYFFSKLKFDWIKRDSWDPYFTHLEETARIILKEFENPTFEKVILALLHDIIEDTDISYDELIKFFGSKCLDRILNISKNDKRLKWMIKINTDNCSNLSHLLDKIIYFTFDSKKITKQLYFQRLLSIDDDVVIDVKLADRLHNLRTMYIWKPEKVRRKIRETLFYILPLAKKNNNTKARRLILCEIQKLQLYFNLKKSK